MASRKQSTNNFSSRTCMNLMSDLDRMRALTTNMHNGNNLYNELSGYPASALPTSYLNSGNPSMPSASATRAVPPPLPPRADVSRYNRYSNYNNYCSPYSRFSPGMYSPAFGGGYGGYRSSYGHYGMPHESYNSFIQLAEESTRPAFESIESVVDIVGSISMMLESSYHAVYSSYHAILGVVDQFSRLRDHLAEVLSVFALLRGLRYLCLKILYLLRLQKNNPSVEAAWNSARSASQNSDSSAFHDRKSPWPFFMFIGLIIGAPWLVFKLLSRSVAKKSFDKSAWSTRGGILVCTANYDFNTTRRGELSFSAGDNLYVAPKNLQANVPKGWMLACTRDNKVGLIPSNYLKLTPTSTGAFRVASQMVPLSADNVLQTEGTEVIPERLAESSRNVTINPFAESESNIVNPFAESENITVNPLPKSKNTPVGPLTKSKNNTRNSVAKCTNNTGNPLTKSKNITVGPPSKSKNTTVDPLAESENVTVDPFAESTNITVDPLAESTNITVDPLAESENVTVDPLAESESVTVDPFPESKNVTINPLSESKNVTVDPLTVDDPVPPIISTSSIVENDSSSENKE